jgi:hypothetical protein
MRYITDIRIGCGAILDTMHPDYKEKNGLYQDDIGIVYYIHGDVTTDHNGSYSWVFSKDKEEFLKKICNFLNANHELNLILKRNLYRTEVLNSINDFENGYIELKQLIDEFYDDLEINKDN